MTLIRRDAVPRLLGVAEQPRDPGVDEIVRAVKVEGLAVVLGLGRLADIRAHGVYVNAISWPRARRMQEERFLEHSTAAQRALRHVFFKLKNFAFTE